MRKMPKFVDMARTPEKPPEVAVPSEYPQNLYPYGLCISLSQEDLDKLDLDTAVDAGDFIHLHALGKVTSVSKRDTDQGQDMRVEIQLTSIAVEDEGEENEEAERSMPRPRNFYKK